LSDSAFANVSSLDPTGEFNRLARRATRSPFVKNVLASLSGHIMMIGVDALDYTKGLPLRMEAFEHFLNAQTDWRGLVVYLQITPKNQTDIAEYADIERTLGATAGRINATYGEPFWTPIRYVNRTYSRADLAGLLSCSARCPSDPAARWNEPRGERVYCGLGCRGSRRTHPLAIRGGGCRVKGCAARQSM
jgi:trehalose-6-phosphate synthase